MAKWTAFPHDNADYVYDAAALKKKWARLHAGDAEPLPKDDKVLAAWALFHAGEFQKACDAGVADACGTLGYLYSQGVGVPRDQAKANALWTRACNKGNKASCDRLGR